MHVMRKYNAKPQRICIFFDCAREENVADSIFNIFLKFDLFYFCNKQFHDWLTTEGI